MIEITKEQFEDIALKAFSRIPAPFQKILNNVDVSIEDWPSEEQIESLDISSRYDLYGLYSGLPLNERGYVETAPPNLIVLLCGDEPNIWIASQPISEARGMDLSIPPAVEMCAPISMLIPLEIESDYFRLFYICTTLRILAVSYKHLRDHET